MKNGRIVTCSAILLAGLLWACAIPDEDRCASGYVYVPELKACQMPPDASLPAPDAASTPASTDPTASEAGSGPSFGSVCANASDCKSSTTDYCVMSPGAATGYCSKANCAADCPSGYKCCNCPAFGMVACITSTETAGLTALGCTCS